MTGRPMRKASEIKNLPASVQSRLLNQAKASKRPFAELLQYYAIERFLYCLSRSPYQSQFVLKGALMFVVWGAPVARPTRDIDLLGHVDNAIDKLVEIAREICRQPVELDGVEFDAASVIGEIIKEGADYEGVRLRFLGYLGTARVTMQIDVGFADAVTPGPVMVVYPSMLGMPAPELRGYTRETAIAEKAHAMIVLGSINSRMKDFFDLWILARQYDFDCEVLAAAIRRTFERRGTPVPASLSREQLQQFAIDKQTQWQAFLRRNQLVDAPTELSAVLHVVEDSLSQPLQTAAGHQGTSAHWVAGLGWENALLS